MSPLSTAAADVKVRRLARHREPDVVPTAGGCSRRHSGQLTILPALQDTAPDVYETEDVPQVAGRHGEVRQLSQHATEPRRLQQLSPNASDASPCQLDDSDDDLPGAGAGPSMRRTGSAPGLNEAIDESGLPSFDQAGRKFGALAASELNPLRPLFAAAS